MSAATRSKTFPPQSHKRALSDTVPSLSSFKRPHIDQVNTQTLVKDATQSTSISPSNLTELSSPPTLAHSVSSPAPSASSSSSSAQSSDSDNDSSLEDSENSVADAQRIYPPSDANSGTTSSSSSSSADSELESVTDTDSGSSSGSDHESDLDLDIDSPLPTDPFSTTQHNGSTPQISLLSVGSYSPRPPSITQLPRPPPITPLLPPSVLQSRLSEFLPALRTANQDLEIERQEGRLGERDIENLDEEEGGQYIEMDLGLGVLEEKRHGDGDYDGDDSSENGSESEAVELRQEGKRESDVLGRLMGMGRRKRGERPGIEVVGGVF